MTDTIISVEEFNTIIAGISVEEFAEFVFSNFPDVRRTELVAGMKAWGAPLPEDAKPSFEFLLGYFCINHDYDLWHAELMARAFPHLDDIAVGLRIDEEGDLVTLKASESDEPPARTRGEILEEIGGLSHEATDALVAAFRWIDQQQED